MRKWLYGLLCGALYGGVHGMVFVILISTLCLLVNIQIYPLVMRKWLYGLLCGALYGGVHGMVFVILISSTLCLLVNIQISIGNGEVALWCTVWCIVWRCSWYGVCHPYLVNLVSISQYTDIHW